MSQRYLQKGTSRSKQERSRVMLLCSTDWPVPLDPEGLLGLWLGFTIKPTKG